MFYSVRFVSVSVDLLSSSIFYYKGDIEVSLLLLICVFIPTILSVCASCILGASDVRCIYASHCVLLMG